MSPKVSDLKNSQFLTKEDVEPDVLATIKSYEMTDVSMESEARKDRYVLHFKEVDKPMVLNVTNGRLLEAITGSDDFDSWIGQQIVLYNDKTIMFQGKLTGGIRIRAPRNRPALRHQTEPDATEPDATEPDATEPESDLGDYPQDERDTDGEIEAEARKL